MKIIACYSNKGGVGKTASSANLAHLMAQSGHKVLLCDLDPQGASSFYFRLKPAKKLSEDSFFTDQDKLLKAIKGSDYENLDVLPANMDFRDFDIFLSRMAKGHSALKKALKSVKKEYDFLLLDCPPTISMLSESVFSCADWVLVPVIPSTLSERTLKQLLDFFTQHKLDKSKILAFFSMVQVSKKLHLDTMQRLGEQHADLLLNTYIPFSSHIERMGVNRAPATDFAKATPAAQHYLDLWRELATRI